MIKFSGKNEHGRMIVGLGLSAMNVQKLKEGLPIHIHADELGFPGEIVIFYGETEDAMAAQIKEVMEIGEYRDTRKQKRH